MAAEGVKPDTRFLSKRTRRIPEYKKDLQDLMEVILPKTAQNHFQFHHFHQFRQAVSELNDLTTINKRIIQKQLPPSTTSV